MKKSEILKEARLLAKNYGCTLKTQKATLNGRQLYKIINRASGLSAIENMTLETAWETLLCGIYFENNGYIKKQILDFTKNESDNIKILSGHIQNNGSSELSRLFRIDFLKIDEIQEEYISIVNNTYVDIKKEIKEIKKLIQNLGYGGSICI